MKLINIKKFSIVLAIATLFCVMSFTTAFAEDVVTEPVTEPVATEPVTQEPVTEPVTQEPVTEPVTQAPETEPVTQAPETEPVTQAPETEPATEPETEPAQPAETTAAIPETLPAPQPEVPAKTADDGDLVGIGYCSTAKVYKSTLNALRVFDSEIVLSAEVAGAEGVTVKLTALSVLFNSIIIKFCTEGKNPAPNTEKLP